jgi:hypothetical protein
VLTCLLRVLQEHSSSSDDYLSNRHRLTSREIKQFCRSELWLLLLSLLMTSVWSKNGPEMWLRSCQFGPMLVPRLDYGQYETKQDDMYKRAVVCEGRHHLGVNMQVFPPIAMLISNKTTALSDPTRKKHLASKPMIRKSCR